MKRFDVEDINTPKYWDQNQTAMDFGLRQQEYARLINGREKVVELGCGFSPFLFRINNKERSGLDYSPKTIRRCRKEYPGVIYKVGDVIDTHYKSNYFDAVVAGEVIEHLEYPDKLLDEMWRICKPMGIMVVSTPLLEFQDPEHLWEFDVDYFKFRGFFDVNIMASERFPGRKYIFAWKIKR